MGGVWQWESTDRCECERCRRQREVYLHLRKSNRLVARFPNGLGAWLSNKCTSVIFLIHALWIYIRHFSRPQVTSPHFSSITSSDCHFLSIIITAYLRSSFAALLWLSICIRTDFNRRLWCGSGRAGVFIHIYLDFKNWKRAPFREIDPI